MCQRAEAWNDPVFKWYLCWWSRQGSELLGVLVLLCAKMQFWMMHWCTSWRKCFCYFGSLKKSVRANVELCWFRSLSNPFLVFSFWSPLAKCTIAPPSSPNWLDCPSPTAAGRGVALSIAHKHCLNPPWHIPGNLLILKEGACPFGWPPLASDFPHCSVAQAITSMSYCQARVIAKPILPLMDISKSMGGSMGTIKGNYVFLKAENGLILRGGGEETQQWAWCSVFLLSHFRAWGICILYTNIYRTIPQQYISTLIHILCQVWPFHLCTWDVIVLLLLSSSGVGQNENIVVARYGVFGFHTSIYSCCCFCLFSIL